MNMLHQRYILLDELGKGGMGTVYRALDRLTMRTVALKRVLHPRQLQTTRGDTTASANYLTETDDSALDDTTLRLILAREFQTLAGLQHPNIIKVLDYGFDSDGLPFFTMRWLKDARNILAAGRDLPVLGRIELVVQLLRALNYLHQRHILHRDIKPNNVLVSPHGMVYVLDFGLALSGTHTAQPGGSVPYLAPEILSGKSPSVASDLYAVGVIFYELLLGNHPFGAATQDLLDAVLQGQPNLDGIDDSSATLSITDTYAFNRPDEPDLFGIDNVRLAEIMRRLLARTPEQRFGAVAEVVQELADAVDFSIPLETRAIQESIIRQPNFIGRRRELRFLTDALDDVIGGQSAAWLVAGESGVGKTRLVSELRIRAMVRGVPVIYAQASSGMSNRQLWQPVVRRLLLNLQPSEAELSVLRELEPRADNYTAHRHAPSDTTPNYSSTHPDDPQRFMHAWRILLSRQPRPVLIIIENLHLAMFDSLNRLQRLMKSSTDLPVYWLGTFRDDESPALPKRLSHAAVLKLPRLSSTDIKALCAALIGVSPPRQDLLDMLERDTGGNPFLMIESIRVLAQQLGGLAAIRHGSLPSSLRTPSTEALVQRRLAHIPAVYRHLFLAAALDGRQLDVAMLRQLAPDVDLERWLIDALNAAVLTLQDGEWYFSHEQLREGVIAHFLQSSHEKQALHCNIAAAIEQAYGDIRPRASALAHHHEACGDLEAARHYMAISGELLYKDHLYNDAIPYLQRACDLMASLELAPTPMLRNAYVHRLLGAAYLRTNNTAAAHQTTLYALHLLGEVVPSNAAQLSQRLQHAYLQRYSGDTTHTDTPPARPPTAEITQYTERALCYDQLATIAMLRYEPTLAAYAALRGVILAEEIGASAVLARLYATHARSLQLQGDTEAAMRNAKRAVLVAQVVNDTPTLGWSALQQAMVMLTNARWDEAGSAADNAHASFTRTADHRRREEARRVHAYIALEHDLDLPLAYSCWQEILDTARRRQDTAMTVEAYNGLATVLLRDYKQLDVALETTYKARSLALEADDPVSVWALGLTAMGYAYRSEYALALRYAMRATDAVMALHNQTVLWRVVGLDATLFTLLNALVEEQGDRVVLLAAASRVQYALSSMITMFPIAQPSAQRWLGLRAFLENNLDRATTHWQSSLEHAATLQMPYEQARTLIEYSRILAGDAQHTSRHRAHSILQAAGATSELQRLAAL